MSFRRFVLIACACGAFAVINTAAARAGNYGFGCGGHYFGNQTAFGVSGTLYGLGKVPVPPYFSIHPPVYYSYPVARPYGYSPHAARSFLPAVELERDKRTLIRNIFYTPSVTTPTGNHEKFAETSIQPVEPKLNIIVNPFYREKKDAKKFVAQRP